MKRFISGFAILLFVTGLTAAQIPAAAHIAILKAEDSRDYNGLKPFIFSKDLRIQARAVLAAARIGEGSSVDALATLLENGDTSVRPLAAFALGETEAEHAAVFILRALADPKTSDVVRARAVEAAGKIAAANPKDDQFKGLGTAILDVLTAEDAKGKGQNRETILLGLTAALRARPEGSDVVTAKYLSSADAAIRTSAGNTMARLRGKNANVTLRSMLTSDTDPSARANAARALGAAEDKESLDLLLNAAINDRDSRVRVSAIRSLAALKDTKAADGLLKRGEDLLAAYSKTKKPNFIPVEQSEFIEVATALGRILANSDNPRADKLFADFGKLDKGHTPEVYIARVRVGPKRGDGSSPELVNWRQYSSMAQIIGEFAAIEPTSEVGKQMKTEAPGIIRPLAKAFAEADPATEGERMMAGPDVLRAFARFKTDDLAEILRTALKNRDVQMRATAAGLIAELPKLIADPTRAPDPKVPVEPSLSQENLDALRGAFEYARVNDVGSNDAMLATIDALAELDPAGLRWRSEMLLAVRSPDYLVRKKTMDLIPNIPLVWESFPFDSLHGSPGNVKPYSGKGTKIGQVLSKDSDYRRAAARMNGNVKAVFTTEKGTFTIDLLPEDAPLTVDNFVKLANAKYFNGLEVHRVVPNFVMQDGDPRGDGNGGPGWSIRCEMNMVPFDRGAVGMALSGKDTGGSQWFVTHAAQPHLDGGYTVFGRVKETDMKVVDNIVRGDKILTVRVIEGNSTQRPARLRSK